MTTPETHCCPKCHGEGTHSCFFDGPFRAGFERKPCDTCKGDGRISHAHFVRIKEGAKVRKQRINSGITLREGASMLGITPTQLSAIERGEAA